MLFQKIYEKEGNFQLPRPAVWIRLHFLNRDSNQDSMLYDTQCRNKDPEEILDHRLLEARAPHITGTTVPPVGDNWR